MLPTKYSRALTYLFVCAALAPAAYAQPLTSHPRLFIRSADLPGLRARAVAGNSIYQNGLAVLATSAKADMDAGLITTAANGTSTYVTYPAEMYSELFAFLSLISPDQPTRDDYGQRARTLLMYVMNQAAPGAAAGQPYRDPDFSVNDRSRWWGEGFGLTVDWIYSYLSANDKTTIRQVFLRWINEDLNATRTTYDHPTPIGTVNSSALIANRAAVRGSGNNYFTAHMRNIGLMAASFDAADDPGGTLTGFLANATGAWLYIIDNLMRTDSAGGLLPEGFEYSPQTGGYVVELLLALKSAGLDNPATYGTQVVLANNPFWDQVIPAYLHSLSPVPSSNQDVGQAYLPAWYGDGQSYYAPDIIWTLGPLAVYDAIAGNTNRLSQIRWIETNLAPGGASGFARRTRDGNYFLNSIFYFLLFDPAATAPTDPRPAQNNSLFVPGLGRILARTGWDPNAAWFTYKLSFNQVDHQTVDGNMIEFYRGGEWLTKQRTGYFLDDESSINSNTLAIQNNAVQRGPTDYRTVESQLGSQFAYVSSGDPTILARSLAANFTYVTGDATNLYNSTNEGVTDIVHASRSVMWLQPDYVVVYDRAVSSTPNRFKRFWLNLPTLPVVSGNRATMTAASGQKLFVTSLLPAVVAITAQQSTVIAGDLANFEPMAFRLEVEATGGPASARFLHVLQGADAGQSAASTTLIQSSAGTAFDGVAVASLAVLFPVSTTAAFTTTTYSAPAFATLHRVTGLTPGSGYNVSTSAAGANMQVIVAAGGTIIADSGGVLEFPVTGAVPTSQTITFDPIAGQTLGTAPPALNATATSGLTVTFTSNSTGVCTVAGTAVTLVTAGSCSITASQSGNGTFAGAAPITQTFTVNKAANAIAFGSPGTQTLGTAAPALSATATSGLTVTFASNSTDVCTVAGTAVTLVTAGSCSITASQGGNGTFAAAASIIQTFAVNKTANTITFGPLATQTLGTEAPGLTATASSGLTVTYLSNNTSVCTVAAATITLIAAGTCSITASQSGNGIYAPAASVTQTFSVSLTPQTISFGPINTIMLSSTPPGLSATATSGLTVTFAANTPGICSVAITTVTLVASGTCSITASQSGNATYAAAPAVTQTFLVTALTPQSVAFGTIGTQTLGTAPPGLSATATSGLTVTFASNSTPICMVSGTAVTLGSAGTCSITATQDGNGTFAAATPVTQTFLINKAANSISFASPGTQTIGINPPALSATATSGLPVIFASTTTGVCTVLGTAITLVAAGTCSITANQAGNGIFAAANPVSQSFVVAGGKISSAGIFRRGNQFLLDAANDHLAGGTGDFVYNNFIAFASGDKPVSGDWNGTGTSKIGIYRPSTGTWFLDTNGDGVFDAGDQTFQFGGIAGDVPVVGDWSGSGASKIGLVRPFTSGGQPALWILDSNGNGSIDSGDQVFGFGGIAGDTPVVGDWNGDGKTKVGMVRPFITGGVAALWILDANNDHSIGAGDLIFAFGGIAGDTPVVGDWNGSGTTKVAVVRPFAPGGVPALWITDYNGSAPTILGGGNNAVFAYGGIAGDIPFTGQWR